MVIEKNTPLHTLHTFGLEASCQYFTSIDSIEDLQLLLQQHTWAALPRLILGGGSNMVFMKDFKGIVLKNNIKGIEVIDEDENNIRLKIGGGENWHTIVMQCVENGYGGIENLSLIPGTVGAAPIQNIGAYGVELKDVFVELEALHLETLMLHRFDKATCQFGYRDSIFKNKEKGKYLIATVTLQLTKQNHQLNTDYGAIKNTLAAYNITAPTIKDISDAVIAIRQSKLPDPKKIGNAGSFFKNPIISSNQFKNLQEKFPDIIHYPVDKDHVKVPAGWLIDQCGWKGKKLGKVGSYKNQALVLVNHGGATGEELMKLVEQIIHSVKEKYGIELTPEVNII